MKAMLLAAGRGRRMRPLTDHCPKPLLPVAGRPLIAHHLRRLGRAGFLQVVINTAYRGGQIREFVGDGHAFGVCVEYSDEGDHALETGGGIRKALPLLVGDHNAPFAVINADVYSDYPLERLRHQARRLRGLAHLVMVDNPGHHPHGDFCVRAARAAPASPHERTYTYSGIGIYHARLLNDLPPRPAAFALAPILARAAASGEISAELYHGFWSDVGTPSRLADLEQALARYRP